MRTETAIWLFFIVIIIGTVWYLDGDWGRKRYEHLVPQYGDQTHRNR